MQTSDHKDISEKDDDDEDVFHQSLPEEGAGLRMGRRCLTLEGSDTIHQISTTFCNDVSLCKLYWWFS